MASTTLTVVCKIKSRLWLQIAREVSWIPRGLGPRSPGQPETINRRIACPRNLSRQLQGSKQEQEQGEPRTYSRILGEAPDLSWNCLRAKMSRTRDAEAELNLPPGFRFHPTDEELVVHYLCRKAADRRLPVPIIAEIDLYKFNPWDLPGIKTKPMQHKMIEQTLHA